MAYGKTVKIYLSDGTPSGVRHAEIIGWTGQAIACSRSRIPELRDWSEIQRPGIYFLLWRGDSIDAGRVYVGETEEMLKRLTEQTKAMDFWNEAVAFTSKDENLTKGHIKYLERRLVALTETVGRYEVENKNSPQSGYLPRSEADAMEEFIDNLRIVLGTLGYRFLEPISASATVGPSHQKPENPILGTKLSFEFLGMSAYGTQSDQGFIVFSGSCVTPSDAESLSPVLKAQKSELVEGGVLALHGSKYRFQRDYVFNSPSAAASLVSGAPRSGPQSWHDETGKSLKQLEEDMLKGFDDEEEQAGQQ